MMSVIRAKLIVCDNWAGVSAARLPRQKARTAVPALESNKLNMVLRCGAMSAAPRIVFFVFSCRWAHHSPSRTISPKIAQLDVTCLEDLMAERNAQSDNLIATASIQGRATYSCR